MFRTNQHKFNTDTHELSFVSHSGLYPLSRYGSKDDCLHDAKILADFRAHEGYRIAEVDDGWEFSEPEDAIMNSDLSGLLWITEIVTPEYECFNCGCSVPEGTECSCHIEDYYDLPEPWSEEGDHYAYS